MWVSTVVIIGVGLAALGVFLTPAARASEAWRATRTPLASIIGSGFLVLGPLLVREYGRLAPLVMVGLCAVAYAFGDALRYNIRFGEPRDGAPGPTVHRLEALGSAVLAGAYVVSVCYYLNLLGSFAVSLTPWDSQVNARIVSSAVLGMIGGVGVVKGLEELEALEGVAVTLKLSIIASLLAGMALFLGSQVTEGSLPTHPDPALGAHSLFLAFGLVICVQGFETSRYLGDEYSSELRVNTMRWAQLGSGVLYVVYVAFITASFRGSELSTTETAIIDLTEVMNPVLPYLLVVAALAAQFSAAVADTVGCGGLVNELSGQRLPAWAGYVGVAAGGLALTWTADVFLIIAYASRAFALYYAVQAGIAAVVARQRGSWRWLGYAALAALGLAMMVLGIPAEG